MGINFPNAPTTGQLYPVSPPPGTPQYRWDGEKWSQSSLQAKQQIYADGSVPMTGQLTVVAPPVNPTDAAAKSYVDSVAGPAGGTVHYDTAQSLTDAQKIQARSNVYAAPFDALGWSGMQVNGSCDVSQELGTSGVSVSTGTTKYFCDGWQLSCTGSMVVAGAQIKNPLFPGFQYFANSNATTAQASLGAGDYAFAMHSIEGWRLARLAWGTANAQPLSIGFFTCHSRAGNYSGVVRNAAANRSYAFTYAQNVAAAVEYKTITIPGCPDGVWNFDNTVGLSLLLAIACGTTFTAPSANTWLTGNYVAAPGQVNNVQAVSDSCRWTGLIVLPGIELPSASRAPFIMRPYDQELIACKRYWEKNVGPTPVTLAAGICHSATFAIFHWNFEVEKRIGPVCTGTGAGGLQVHFASSLVAISSIAAAQFGVKGARMDATVAGGLAGGNGAVLEVATSGSGLFADARM